MKLFNTAACALALAATLGVSDVYAQSSNSEPSQRTPPGIALEVDVVLSRFEGQKKVANSPYMLSVNTAQPPRSPVQLRVLAQVPISAPSQGTGNDSAGRGPIYREIGTSIDCGATALDDGSFQLTLTISDSSLWLDKSQAGTGPPPWPAVPAFRSFRSSGILALGDGESTQLIAATDRVSGETIRVDVTLRVVK